MRRVKRVSPSILYPMTTIESINPKILEHVVQMVKNEKEMQIIEVIEYKGYYIILDGDYEMLAANIIGKSQVTIEIVSDLEKYSWMTEGNIDEQLKCVGMTALHDFEALGGFKYLRYPDFYKGGKE